MFGTDCKEWYLGKPLWIHCMVHYSRKQMNCCEECAWVLSHEPDLYVYTLEDCKLCSTAAFSKLMFLS